jgi:hypothetical protein
MRTGRSKQADGDKDEPRKNAEEGSEEDHAGYDAHGAALALGVGVALEQRTETPWARSPTVATRSKLNGYEYRCSGSLLM